MKQTIRHARVTRSSFRILIDDAYVKTKKYPGWKVTSYLFERVYELMKKRGFLQPYIHDKVVDTYDYTPSKAKLLSDKVLEMIYDYEKDYGRVDPDNFVVIMGEDTFFRTVRDADIGTPFFYQPVDFSTDITYNDPYRGRRFNAFKVHVVPGVDGAMILPKVVIENRKPVSL